MTDEEKALIDMGYAAIPDGKCNGVEIAPYDSMFNRSLLSLIHGDKIRAVAQINTGEITLVMRDKTTISAPADFDLEVDDEGLHTAIKYVMEHPERIQKVIPKENRQKI